MSEPIVNEQITDAVTQSNVKVVGESPAMAMGTLYQSMAQASATLFQNSVSAQQEQNTLAQAGDQGEVQIYSLDTLAGAAAAEAVAQGGVEDNISGLLTEFDAFKSNQP